MTDIERAARAIYEQRYPGARWDDDSSMIHERYLNDARACLAAICEPSGARGRSWQPISTATPQQLQHRVLLGRWCVRWCVDIGRGIYWVEAIGRRGVTGWRYPTLGVSPFDGPPTHFHLIDDPPEMPS